MGLRTLILGRCFHWRAAGANLELLCPRVVCGHLCSDTSRCIFMAVTISHPHNLSRYHVISGCRGCCTHLHMDHFERTWQTTSNKYLNDALETHAIMKMNIRYHWMLFQALLTSHLGDISYNILTTLPSSGTLISKSHF